MRAINAVFTVPWVSAPVCCSFLPICAFLVEQLLALVAGELLVFGIGGSRI